MEDVLGGRLGAGLALPVAELCGPAGMGRCGGWAAGRDYLWSRNPRQKCSQSEYWHNKVSLASEASRQGQERFVSRAGRWQWGQHPLASEGKHGEDGHRVPDGD